MIRHDQRPWPELSLLLYVSGLLHRERIRRGTRSGTRRLTCFTQATYVIAWFRDCPDVERLGTGFGFAAHSDATGSRSPRKTAPDAWRCVRGRSTTGYRRQVGRRVTVRMLR